MDWIGSVEVHVRSSEWNDHGHQPDPAYVPVILHVVWEKDIEVFRADGTKVPTFELRDKVPLEVLLRYRELMDPRKQNGIPCTPFLPEMEPIRLAHMQERVLVERLERKAHKVLAGLEAEGKDRLSVLFRSLAYGLGLKANAEALETLASTVSVKSLLQLGRQELIQTILEGQAGLIGEGEQLKWKTYCHYRDLWELPQPHIHWEKCKVRPGAFPQKKVRQLADLVLHLPFWLAYLEDQASHYLPFPWTPVIPGIKEAPNLSRFLKDHLMINVLVPFGIAIGLQNENHSFIETALRWVHDTHAEENHITRLWADLGIICTTGGQTQAMLELFQNYCLQKKCLDCHLGTHFLQT
jgi:hypothetical protein